MLPKIPTRPDKIRKLSFSNSEYSKNASALYSGQGFCVLKNFLTDEEVNLLRTRYSDDKHFVRPLDYVAYSHMYKNKPSNLDKDFYQIARKTFSIRNKIALQPNSDFFLLDYCNRHRLDPEDIDKIIDSQMNHTYIRVTNHKNGDRYPKHMDYPSELQCIVLLTERDKDYEEGGLVFTGTDNHDEIDIESQARVGDLIIINGYRHEHYVKPIKCKDNQIGRLTLFMPVIPEYLFPNFYYFKDSKYRLHFPTHPDRLYKIRCYVSHILKLLMKKSVPLDAETPLTKPNCISCLNENILIF